MNELHDSPLDQATARRLSRLAGVPVDTAGLESRLRAQLPARPGVTWRHWLRPVLAVAASLLMVLALALPFWLGGEVQASGAEMVQMHADLVAGKVASVRAGSIEEASQAIAAQWAGGVTLPRPPSEHVKACCMRSVQNKNVACVLLERQGVPVTMAVAKAVDISCRCSGTASYQGQRYSVEKIGSLQMVMTERSGRMVCLIGALPAETLMELASQLQF